MRPLLIPLFAAALALLSTPSLLNASETVTSASICQTNDPEHLSYFNGWALGYDLWPEDQVEFECPMVRQEVYSSNGIGTSYLRFFDENSTGEAECTVWSVTSTGYGFNSAYRNSGLSYRGRRSVSFTLPTSHIGGVYYMSCEAHDSTGLMSYRIREN